MEFPTSTQDIKVYLSRMWAVRLQLKMIFAYKYLLKSQIASKHFSFVVLWHFTYIGLLTPGLIYDIELKASWCEVYSKNIKCMKCIVLY